MLNDKIGAVETMPRRFIFFSVSLAQEMKIEHRWTQIIEDTDEHR